MIPFTGKMNSTNSISTAICLQKRKLQIYYSSPSPTKKVLKIGLLASYWFKPRAKGRNIVDQQLPTLLFVCTLCCMWLVVVAQSFKLVSGQTLSQRLQTFLLFRDRRSVAQQCWIRLLSSSNIVGATHAHYRWFPKTYGLYPSPDALQVPTLLGVVAAVCTPLPTPTRQLPTLLAQHCWESLHPFAHHCQHQRDNSQHCWPNNVVCSSNNCWWYTVSFQSLQKWDLSWRRVLLIRWQSWIWDGWEIGSPECGPSGQRLRSNLQQKELFASNIEPKRLC